MSSKTNTKPSGRGGGGGSYACDVVSALTLKSRDGKYPCPVITVLDACVCHYMPLVRVVTRFFQSVLWLLDCYLEETWLNWCSATSLAVWPARSILIASSSVETGTKPRPCEPRSNQTAEIA